jgi:hypothetical protein
MTTLRPGGQFDVHKFYKELAVGTGFGLRFDFSFFVLRFDLAFPIRKTYVVGETTIGEGDDEQKIPLNEFRWAIKDIDFSSKILETQQPCV